MFTVYERTYGIEEQWDSPVAQFDSECDALDYIDECERSHASIFLFVKAEE